mgnify:CR=1 FL=1
MKKIITLLAMGTLCSLMSACTTYGDPYSPGYYSSSASFNVESAPEYYQPRYYQPRPQYQEPYSYPMCPPRVRRYQGPYTYEVLDLQSNTSFRVQDRRQSAREGCNPKPTFFYVP